MMHSCFRRNDIGERQAWHKGGRKDIEERRVKDKKAEDTNTPDILR